MSFYDYFPNRMLAQIFDSRADYIARVAEGYIAKVGKPYWVDGLPYIGVPNATATGLLGLMPHPKCIVLFEHYDGGPGRPTASNRAALDAIQANHIAVSPTSGDYSFGDTVYEITKPGFTIQAQEYGRAVFFWTGANASGLRVRPANTENGSFINAVRVVGVSIVGPQLAHVSGIGLEVIMSNGGLFDVRVVGWQRNVRFAGGQLNEVRSITCFARSGGIIADVAGSYCLSIGPHVQGDGTRRPCFTLGFGHVILSGDVSNNVEDIVVISGVDDVQFTTGYVAWGRRSMFKFSPLADSGEGTISANLGSLYCDGKNVVTHGLYFVQDWTSARCIVDASTASIVNTAGTTIWGRDNTINELRTSGRIANAGGWLVDVELGVNSSIVAGKAVFANGASGGVKVNGGADVVLSGNVFEFNGPGGDINLSGTINSMCLGQNAHRNSVAKVVNTATIATPSDGAFGGAVARVEFGGASTGVTFSTATCKWSVQGNRVQVTVTIVLTSKGSATGELRVISGLPVSFNAVENTAMILSPQNIASGSGSEALACDVIGGTRAFRIGEMRTSGGGDFRVAWTDADVRGETSPGAGDGTVIRISGSWEVA